MRCWCDGEWRCVFGQREIETDLAKLNPLSEEKTLVSIWNREYKRICVCNQNVYHETSAVPPKCVYKGMFYFLYPSQSVLWRCSGWTGWVDELMCCSALVMCLDKRNATRWERKTNSVHSSWQLIAVSDESVPSSDTLISISPSHLSLPLCHSHSLALRLTLCVTCFGQKGRKWARVSASFK